MTEPDRAAVARAAFTKSLDEIEHALAIATPPGADCIRPRSAEYYAASMVLIRMAALFENDHFTRFLGEVPPATRRAITTMRNIAAHAGYQQMDDRVLWRTLTIDLPPLVAQLRRSVRS